MKPNSQSNSVKPALSAPAKFPYGLLAAAVALSVGMIVLIVWFSERSVSGAPPLFSTRTHLFISLGIVGTFALTISFCLIVIRRLTIFNRLLLSIFFEKKTAEARLKASETKLRDFFENTNDIFFTCDLNGNFDSLNHSAEAATGYSRDEAMTMNIADIILPGDLEMVREMIARKLNGEASTVYEIEVLSKDGRRIPLELSTRLIKKGSQAVGIQGIARDIAVRRAGEEAIKKSEAKYRSLVDSLPAIVYVVAADAPYNPIYVSPTIESLGYTPEQWASGTDFWDSVIEPADRSRVIGENKIALSETGAKEIEYRVAAADGSVRWLSDRGQFVTGENGERLYWQGVIFDISQVKTAEEKIRESEQSYRFLSEGIIHHVWTAFPDGRMEYANERAASYFGISKEELIKQGWMTFISRDDLHVILKQWNHSLETGDYFEAPCRLKGADGTFRWHVARATAGRNADGSIVKWFGTNTDVDEKMHATDSLGKSERKFRTLLENMGEGLLQVDKDNVIEFVNNRFCEMTGYSEAELLGKSSLELLFDDDAAKFFEQRDERLREGRSENYELTLRTKSGVKLWVMVGGAPTYDSSGAVNGSMGVFTDITKHKLSEQRLLHDAFHDHLTGLANRALFTDHLRLRIERAKREQSSYFAVLFLDFDRFKVINDSLGHAEGDKLLIAVAKRLESTLRSSDLIARLGGDEFTILLNELDDISHATLIASRIQELLQTPFELKSGEVFLSASIGIALSTDQLISAEDMLRNADIAMYRAKAKGKARHQLFDQAMHEEAISQMQLDTDLRHALARNEFLLHYQPIFDLESEAIVGFEALLRWNHPERGMVSPDDFIPIVEENGLIIPLGRWILFESCRQMREWQQLNPAAGDLTINVNLSCKQFSQLDLAEQVMAMLVSTQLDPEFLKLEITESHAMENGEAAVDMMDRLRSIGVELSLDDFGTGFSSLSYLHRLPVSNLKIDRSFISAMAAGDENTKLVKSIISLAHNLKISVTAEGIETAEQVAQLRALRCDNGQGFLFSKALEAAAATEIVKNLPARQPRNAGFPPNGVALIG